MPPECQPNFDHHLQNFLSFNDYHAETSLDAASSIPFYYRDVLPQDGISPENVISLLNQYKAICTKDDMPFHYVFVAGKISLIFSGKPKFAMMLAIFSVLQPEITAGRLQGIAQVTFAAHQVDEITFNDVATMINPNQTIIPFILQHTQTFH